MKTRVTYNDYKGIINSFTIEEIKEKYGYLEIVSEFNYKEKEKVK